MWSGFSASAQGPLFPPGEARFETVRILDDPRHVGGEAYRMLAPAGWRSESNVQWKNGAGDPAAPWVRLIGPARQEIGVLPPTLFFWNPQALGPRVRPGSFYSGTEVQPPMLDALQCLKAIIIPRYRRQLDNADVVKQEALPELAQAVRLKYPGPQFQNAVIQAGRVRFEYVEAGVPMEEDVYVVTVAVQRQDGRTVTTLWAPDEVRYSKAPKGTLDAQLPLFQTAMFSLRPNLQWWVRVQRLTQELSRLQAQSSTSRAAQAMQQQAAAADRLYTNRQLDQNAQNGERISQEMIEAFKNRLAVIDNINAHWDHAAAKVELYRNPATSESVELPSGFTRGWTNKSGDYWVSASDGDANLGSDGSWTRLEKAAH